jgi:hypothetical protein
MDETLLVQRTPRSSRTARSVSPAKVWRSTPAVQEPGGERLELRSDFIRGHTARVDEVVQEVSTDGGQKQMRGPRCLLGAEVRNHQPGQESVHVLVVR